MSSLKKLPILKTINRVFGGRIGILEAAILFSIFLLAFFLRIFPIRWGLYLSEFDPWMQYKEMLFIIDRGWSGFLEFFNWHDIESWYPFGRNVGKTAFPGLPFFAAFLYHVLHGIGVKVNALELAGFLPPILGVLTVLGAYLLGKEVGGKPAGFFAAFFLAINNASIGRTHMGWFDDESLSIPLLVFGLWAYIQAIKGERSVKGVVGYALLSGLLIGYLSATWGASRFPLAFIPLITVILALIGRYRRQLLTAYVITFSTYALMALMVPKLGPKYLFEATLLSGFAALVILLSFEASRIIPGGRHVKRLPYYVVAAGVAGFVGITLIGLARLPGLKFFSVLVPTLRSQLPIVISVAENQVSTWAMLFLDAGFQLLFVPIGLYYALKRREDRDLILAIFTILTLYFASTMVRLSILAAPGIAIMAGYGISEVFQGLGRNLKLSAAGRRRPISPEYYVLTPLIIVGLMAFTLIPSAYGVSFTISSIDAGYVPPTIVSSSVPAKDAIPAWLKTLTWMRENLPEDAVVASWWDYGYWITILGNRTSIVDNATLNSTQIGEVAYAFMTSNETEAYLTFKRLGATHVLIFVTHGGSPGAGGLGGPRLLGFGDEAKWVWMLRIANQVGYNFTESEYLDQQGQPTDKFWETTLGKMIPFKPQQAAPGFVNHIYNPTSMRHFRLVYQSDPPYSSVAYVYIYEIVD